MYENEYIDKIEEGKEYKLGVLQEFLSKYNYQLYSETIRIGCHEQIMCIINKAISKKFQCLSNPQYSRTINYTEVDGIIFAEVKI